MIFVDIRGHFDRDVRYTLGRPPKGYSDSPPQAATIYKEIYSSLLLLTRLKRIHGVPGTGTSDIPWPGRPRDIPTPWQQESEYQLTCPVCSHASCGGSILVINLKCMCKRFSRTQLRASAHHQERLVVQTPKLRIKLGSGQSNAPAESYESKSAGSCFKSKAREPV